MKYSVLIPVYNCEETLQKTIESILQSGLIDYEIILIDDGSQDNSPELCDQLANLHPHIRCVHQENTGASAARNRGIEESIGEYIWFVDADDQIRKINPQVIEAHVNASCDMIMFGMAFQYYNDEKLFMEEVLSLDNTVFFNGTNLSALFKTLFDKNYFSPSWNKLIKRKLIIENKVFFNPQLTNYEDLEFSLQILRYCKSFVALPDVWYEYKNSIGVDHTVERLSQIEHVVDNTNFIARAFFEIMEKYPDDLELRDQITSITLRIYLELCYKKLLTSSLLEIETLCVDFQKNRYITFCNKKLYEMSKTYQIIYGMLQDGNEKKIRDYMRYRNIRHSIGAVARVLLRRR